jgi:RND family efflux transporter MFP subunit
MRIVGRSWFREPDRMCRGHAHGASNVRRAEALPHELNCEIAIERGSRLDNLRECHTTRRSETLTDHIQPNIEWGSASALPVCGKRRSSLYLVVLLSLNLAAAACGGRHTQEKAAERAAVDVAAVAVRLADVPQMHEAGGVVRARTTATITSRLLAPVMEVRVAPGDRVRAGQVLVRLDDRDLSAAERRAVSARQAAEQASRAAEAERDASRASLALATAQHKRMAMLHDRKSATDDELDQAVAGLDAARSRMSAAEARVAETAAGSSAAAAGADAASVGASFAIITAPFDGLVTEKLVEPGNMAAPGTPLLRVEQAGALRLDVRLDESRTAGVHPGQRVHVQFDSHVTTASSSSAPEARGRVEGRVVEVSRAVEAGPHAFLVKIELPPAIRVPSGAFARAFFPGPTRRVAVVPRTAIVSRGQLTSVFVLDGELARLRLVSVGEAVEEGGSPALIEILSGLQQGERVIASPPPALTDGVRVSSKDGQTSRRKPAEAR